MPLCDFKTSRKNETAKGIEVLARLYSGDDVTFTRPNPITEKEETVTEYRRSGVIAEKLFVLKPGVSDDFVNEQIASWAKKLTAAEPVPAQKTVFERAK